QQRVAREELVGLVVRELVVEIRPRPAAVLDLADAAGVSHHAVDRYVLHCDNLFHLILHSGFVMLRAGARDPRPPGPSTWSRGNQSSQCGRYQFQRPSRCITAGSSTERMIVASISRATATPKPICWNMTSSPAAKPAKTATMISAAPVMMRAVEATPNVTASVVSPVWS